MGGNIRRKISAARGDPGLVRTNLCAPDGALVADECADPITSPVTEHWVAILAARYKHVRVIFLKWGEGEVSYRTCMTWGNERGRFGYGEARHNCV